MALRKIMMLGVAAVSLSACMGSDIATREMPLDQALATPNLTAMVPAYNLVSVDVTVPAELSVSEANRYYPVADIVWRGDPMGDRHQQIKAIMDQGFANAAADMNDGRAVKVDVVVKRFHSLTEKARFTVGGVHNVIFDMTVYDAETGELVIPIEQVEMDLPAYGGTRAMDAERRGETQKVRLVAALENLMKRELSTPISGPTADAAVTRHVMKFGNDF